MIRLFIHIKSFSCDSSELDTSETAKTHHQHHHLFIYCAVKAE